MTTHYKGPEKQRTALDCYIKLMRASQATTKRIHRHLRDWKITPSQLGVLDALYHLGPMLQQELAEKNLMSPGNITMIVDNLAKSGLVRRRRQEKDRRAVKVYLTAEGKKLFEDMFPQHVQGTVDEFQILTDAERKEFARLCRKLGLQRAD